MGTPPPQHVVHVNNTGIILPAHLNATTAKMELLFGADLFIHFLLVIKIKHMEVAIILKGRREGRLSQDLTMHDMITLPPRPNAWCLQRVLI